MRLLTLLALVSAITITTAMPQAIVLAADDKAIKAERREAQKQRQQQKRERSNNNNAAIKQVRNLASELKREYQQRIRDLDTDYQLQKEELRAERQTKIAQAEAEMQQNISQLLLSPAKDENDSLEKLKADIKAHADKVFVIRQQADSDQHKEFIANENRKHQLLLERDNKVLTKAKQLGLMEKYPRILAKPLGDGLTKQEQRWNDNEQKNVDRLYKNNQRQLGEFIYGEKLREWEINNKREDFEMEQRKKKELHEIKSEQNYLNALMFSPQKGEQAAQEISKQLTEISKKVRVTNIKYDKEKRQKQIKRKQQRRKITGR